MNDYTEKISKIDLKKKSIKELIGYLKRFAPMQSRMYGYGVLLPLLDINWFSFIETTVKEFLKMKVNKDKVNEYFQIISTPSEESFGTTQEKDLLSLEFKHRAIRSEIKGKELSEVKKAFSEFYKDLQEHTKSHCWVYHVYSGPAFTEDDFFAFIQTHIEKGLKPAEELERIRQEKEELIKRKEEIIAELKPDNFNEEIMRISGIVVWAKPRRKDYQSKSYYHILESVIKELSARTGLTKTEALSIPFEEFDRVDKKKVKQIFEEHVVYIDHGEVKGLYGKKAREFAEKYIKREDEEEISESNEFKGAIACQGYAKGKVKIVNTSNDIQKMEEGDILVSIATTPAIVSAMQKAAAIVTDEGGLTCHAAIVSRELGVPCIIGTKVATKVLKDGDSIVVDAKKGVVRKE
ncbi:hypothetical protein HQ533_00640 [Candidatus Woesearchaeota archaeon]|nr:hypothetical protein [Candidatus Woesearchaeota archaeon]